MMDVYKDEHLVAQWERKCEWCGKKAYCHDCVQLDSCSRSVAECSLMKGKLAETNGEEGKNDAI